MASGRIFFFISWAIAGFAMLVGLLGLGVVASAEPVRATLLDLQIAGHIIHFAGTQSTGDGVVAVVYNRSASGSAKEAAAVAALFDGGLVVDGLRLRPVVIEQSDLGHNGSTIAIMSMQGVQPEPIRAAMRRLHAPCMTIHMPQVEQGSCLVGIRSLPNVRIVLNEKEAEAMGIHFATAFLMMVREL